MVGCHTVGYQTPAKSQKLVVPPVPDQGNLASFPYPLVFRSVHKNTNIKIIYAIIIYHWSISLSLCQFSDIIWILYLFILPPVGCFRTSGYRNPAMDQHFPVHRTGSQMKEELQLEASGNLAFWNWFYQKLWIPIHQLD